MCLWLIKLKVDFIRDYLLVFQFFQAHIFLLLGYRKKSGIFAGAWRVVFTLVIALKTSSLERAIF